MNSDIRDEFGPLDPGLDQVLQAMTAQPTPEELADEQAAVAMFRENRTASARGTRRPRRFVPAAPPPGRPATGQGGWRMRLAAAATIVLAGGLTAAAYEAALPAPVQRIAHAVLSFAGVPEAQHHSPKPSSTASPTTAPGRRPSVSSSPGPRPSSQRSPSARPSSSPHPSVTPAAPGVLSAQAASTQVIAGTQAVIDGTLTRSGRGVADATITLLERAAGQPAWKVAGTADSNADGNVVFDVAALATNAAFRLTGPGTASSTAVHVTVVPPITTTLQLGPRGLRDVLVVSIPYARPGNAVVLQVQGPAGGWRNIRVHVLSASDGTTFSLKVATFKNKVLRVKLRATLRHAASVSAPVTVPVPS